MDLYEIDCSSRGRASECTFTQFDIEEAKNTPSAPLMHARMVTIHRCQGCGNGHDSFLLKMSRGANGTSWLCRGCHPYFDDNVPTLGDKYHDRLHYVTKHRMKSNGM